MFALALGIKNVTETLPQAVYALLSGLNSATVGIVALAAVQLAENAITDKVSRFLVVFGACAGMCYTALWYFPLLIAIGGFVTLIWDLWARGVVGRYQQTKKAGKAPAREESDSDAVINLESTAVAGTPTPEGTSPQHRQPTYVDSEDLQVDMERREAPLPSKAGPSHTLNGPVESTPAWDKIEGTDMLAHAIPVKVGIAIIIAFFSEPSPPLSTLPHTDIGLPTVVSFIAVLVLRGVLEHPPPELDLFANMYLAGTIIFGGGPVVIPLLRSYVVGPGWVSSRDFLLGLAIIQAFPGPNFNFAVFLGALALSHTSYTSPTASSFLGAVLGFIGIFAPGMILAVGIQSLWRVLRTRPTVIALLRGINAAAVGLVFTAVYRLWEIGWLTEKESGGRSLGGDPWWVVIAATSFAIIKWFDVTPPLAILLGGAAGVGWWGVVQA